MRRLNLKNFPANTKIASEEQECLSRDADQYLMHKQTIFFYSLWFVSIWVFSMLGIIVLTGAKVLDLPSALTSVYVGTTTVSVIGLLGYILNGLYISRNRV